MHVVGVKNDGSHERIFVGKDGGEARFDRDYKLLIIQVTLIMSRFNHERFDSCGGL